MADMPTEKNNILDLDEIRAKKRSSTAELLRNSQRIAKAISVRTCVLCNVKKSCVNKTGVCSYCFDNVLTPEERSIAEEEAEHKIIKIQVIDDRWGQ